ncbi:TVP38/TMEM64 family protein [Urbifossiella limnaea]|uniref:TVP38/TMEM64 family membrane protein n=1 Tax=Urbifossiella limnaea TaxID=2528023 RepID=A0A517XQ29_9BACT|nr:VTT domain-containing protein [Urbifossiella limnaea]QDU19617.1 TVP38/TMEM64 family inner membrane protein YdjZ [Urbifossiella limnaea]
MTPDPLPPARFTTGRLLVLAAATAVFVWFVAAGPDEAVVVARSGEWRAAARQHLPAAVGLFVLVEVCLVALSLPVNLWLTVLAGFLFGAGLGTAVVSASSTAGAALAFLLARYVFAGPVRRLAQTRPRLARAFERIDRGVEGHGAFYVAVLRMTPVFPFWLVNLGLALTPIRLRQYAWASWLAMLPVTVVLAAAGAELAEITSFREVLSARVLVLLALMPAVPLALRLVADRWLTPSAPRSGR